MSEQSRGRTPRKLMRTAFCEKHQRNYRVGEGCYDCTIEQLDADILADPNIPEETKELFKALGQAEKFKP